MRPQENWCPSIDRNLSYMKLWCLFCSLSISNLSLIKMQFGFIKMTASHRQREMPKMFIQDMDPPKQIWNAIKLIDVLRSKILFTITLESIFLGQALNKYMHIRMTRKKSQQHSDCLSFAFYNRKRRASSGINMWKFSCFKQFRQKSSHRASSGST